MDSTFHEGWLIKSPPTKRIWRARWRRRWFTLKQGEIPEQFCLEYYTDQFCRKLKGVIDLDQCEQVDCGLRLENRKQKFQFMFDIKTPKRTYYLAAETEASMRDWVNCICQVCHLHDTKQSNELQLGAMAATAAGAAAPAGDENRSGQQHTSSSGGLSNSTQNTTTTSLHSSAGSSAQLRRPVVIDQQPQSLHNNNNNNNSDSVYVNTDYNNRETLLCDAHFDQQQLLPAAQQQPPPSPATALYLNQSALIQAQAQAQAAEQAQAASRLAVSANGVVRKLPEHLVLTQQNLAQQQQQQQQHNSSSSVQASPALSTASGPYIPLSECFTGSPKLLLDSHAAAAGALNNLDDTPRSHNNICLNLTNAQSYSPKITNCSSQLATAVGKQCSQRSDSDSEGVFTDDEWAHPLPLRENVDRSTRPSDSSIENESFVLTFSQRFSKMPEDGVALVPTGADKELAGAADAAGQFTLEKLAKVLKNKNNLILDFKDNEKISRELPQLSDTENTSPAIIASRHLNSSLIEESYDIPRSHQLPYCNIDQLQGERQSVTSPHNSNPIAASTPNLMAEASINPSLMTHSKTMAAINSPNSAKTLPRQHCYTNACPSKMEGNVFRYDFIEQTDCPPVNRKLKPKPAEHKPTLEDKPPEEFPAKPPVGVLDQLSSKLQATKLPPSVDRKCKPNANKLGLGSMSPGSRRSTGAPLSVLLPSDTDVHSLRFHETRTLPRQPTRQHPNSPGAHSVQHQRTASASVAMTLRQQQQQQQQQQQHKLQYLELDVANKPPLLHAQSMSMDHLPSQGSSTGKRTCPAGAQATTTVYKSVDFVKTEAFKRVREKRNQENSSQDCANSSNNK